MRVRYSLANERCLLISPIPNAFEAFPSGCSLPVQARSGDTTASWCRALIAFKRAQSVAFQSQGLILSFKEQGTRRRLSSAPAPLHKESNNPRL